MELRLLLLLAVAIGAPLLIIVIGTARLKVAKNARQKEATKARADNMLRDLIRKELSSEEMKELIRAEIRAELSMEKLREQIRAEVSAEIAAAELANSIGSKN